jgi:hypothetical protein
MGKGRMTFSGCSRKLQRVLFPAPLLNQKTTRVKINFFIYFRQNLKKPQHKTPALGFLVIEKEATVLG